MNENAPATVEEIALILAQSKSELKHHLAVIAALIAASVNPRRLLEVDLAAARKRALELRNAA